LSKSTGGGGGCLLDITSVKNIRQILAPREYFHRITFWRTRPHDVVVVWDSRGGWGVPLQWRMPSSGRICQRDTPISCFPGCLFCLFLCYDAGLRFFTSAWNCLALTLSWRRTCIARRSSFQASLCRMWHSFCVRPLGRLVPRSGIIVVCHFLVHQPVLQDPQQRRNRWPTTERARQRCIQIESQWNPSPQILSSLPKGRCVLFVVHVICGQNEYSPPTIKFPLLITKEHEQGIGTGRTCNTFV